jgi:hypothetical protein
MPDQYVCKVILDQNAGRTPGKETWQFSPRPFIDHIEWGVAGRGSGEVRNVDAVNGDDSMLLLSALFGNSCCTNRTNPNHPANHETGIVSALALFVFHHINSRSHRGHAMHTNSYPAITR